MLKEWQPFVDDEIKTFDAKNLQIHPPVRFQIYFAKSDTIALVCQLTYRSPAVIQSDFKIMQHENKSLQTHFATSPLWIIGTSRSGKTSRLIEQFQQWAQTEADSWKIQPICLVFAAIGDNRLSLADRIVEATQGRYAFDSVTPLSFFETEVMLFWPLLAQQLNLNTQFPLRLRPETEQELATKLWQPYIRSGQFRQAGVSDYFLVRRTLDLLQLAAVGGTPHEQIPFMLQSGLDKQTGSPQLWEQMGTRLEQWWHWCLDRGLLTYSILTELYWRYLLPNPVYQQHLKRRYRAILVDDVDEYPAATRLLFEYFLTQSIPIAFTFNPEGGIRLGLGADPDYLAELASCCQLEILTSKTASLGTTCSSVIECIREPLLLPQLPETIQVVQTVSKAQLLRQTAEMIASAIQSQQIAAEEVAILAPGLDAITRYTLQEILATKGIALLALNSQQPLISSALVRALLSLLAYVYPGLGRLLDRESIAEMLVVLSQSETEGRLEAELTVTDLTDVAERSYAEFTQVSLKPKIDLVRAGLLSDHCFVPDPERPKLLPAQEFARWDRLGYSALQAYSEQLQWLTNQQEQQQQHLLLSPVVLLDRAIQKFLGGGTKLPYNQLAVLRELMETAQHYWEVESRLHQFDREATTSTATSAAVGRFIQLLRAGTITADPFPVRPIGQANQAVTLATLYQYRSQRCHHRWQFWLDAGSPLWLTGASGLFGAPLFQRDRLNQAWTEADALAANQTYLEREILDLLHRADDRLYLCYCELGVNGQEQTGALMPLVNAGLPLHSAAVPDQE